MNTLKSMMVALLLAVTTTGAEAKSIQVPHVYLFGFSASFKDSVVYITDIQDVEGAWIDNKSEFLLGRDNYSYQLRDHFNSQLQMPGRVCMVFFATTRKEAEKKYLKLKRKYTEKAKGRYDVRYLSPQEFKFEPVDMSPEE